MNKMTEITLRISYDTLLMYYVVSTVVRHTIDAGNQFTIQNRAYSERVAFIEFAISLHIYQSFGLYFLKYISLKPLCAIYMRPTICSIRSSGRPGHS